MTDRARSDRQIWITRSHLLALAVATCCIALLAFLVGLQVGRSQAASAEVASDAPLPLTPDASQEEALEALLREVELARATVGPSVGAARQGASAGVELSFPDLLEAETPPVDVPDEPAVVRAKTVAVADPAASPAPPTGSAQAGDVPTKGWSVQVASFPTLDEATATLEDLKAGGHSAYRVSALVDGQTWYRVRIGGFSTKARAEAARSSLSETLGGELILAEAP